MMRLARLVIALMLAPQFTSPVAAEEIVLGLSHNFVPITSAFDGAEILVFGALTSDEGEPLGNEENVHLAVTVAGPPEDVVVRRKTQQAGMWINTHAYPVANVPSFFATAETTPSESSSAGSTPHLPAISVAAKIRHLRPAHDADAEAYLDALHRIGANSGRFNDHQQALHLIDKRLFEARFKLPADVVTGSYKVSAYALRAGKVIARRTATITVDRVGFSRMLRGLAIDHGLAYGLITLAFALMAGWLSMMVSYLMRLVRI